MKRLILIAMACMLMPMMHAQEQQGLLAEKPLTLHGYGMYDRHNATEGYGALAVAADWQLAPQFVLGLGTELTTAQRYAINLQGQVDLWQWRKDTLFASNRYLYRLYPEYGLQEFTGALLLGCRSVHWNLQMGLCNRYMAEIPQRVNGGSGTIFEPMNVMFAAEYRLFNLGHNWNIGARMSNYHDFVIERVTLFFYSLKGYYQLNDDMRLNAEVGCHPAGVLNLSVTADGFFARVGVDWTL